MNEFERVALHRGSYFLCLKHLVPKVDVCSSVIVGQKNILKHTMIV